MHPHTILTLIENRPGTLANDVGARGGVFDRDLTFITEQETTITIWDEGLGGAAISNDLQPRLRYSTLLCSLPEEQATASALPLPFALPEEQWEGRILDTQWQPPHDDYLCAIKELYIRSWVLVTYPLGVSLIPRSYITDGPLHVGDYLRWQPRSDILLAVWRIAQPTLFLTAALPMAEWQRGPAPSLERQRFLTQRRQITPDPANGLYPFAEMSLTRADIEWLLQTHQSASTSGIYAGPVVWDAPEQRDRPGLDMRGADLRGVDLSELPLTRLVGSLVADEWKAATLVQRAQAAIHLEGAQLADAHLEGALLHDAHLKGANLHAAHLASALLRGAYLDEAHLDEADLTQTLLSGASLRAAHLVDARLTQTDLILADLRGADLRRAVLDDVNGQGALFAGTNLQEAQITRSFFYQAHLEHADFTNAQIVDTNLIVIDEV